MPASTMPKPSVNQVVCGQCGKWTDFANDRCPFCGASLFGDEPEYGDEPGNEEDKPHNEEDKSHDTKRSQLVKELRMALFIIGIPFLIYGLIFLIHFIIIH